MQVSSFLIAATDPHEVGMDRSREMSKEPSKYQKEKKDASEYPKRGVNIPTGIVRRARDGPSLATWLEQKRSWFLTPAGQQPAKSKMKVFHSPPHFLLGIYRLNHPAKLSEPDVHCCIYLIGFLDAYST